MAKGNSIILSVPANGHHVEGIAGETLRPGMACRNKAATAPVSGRYTFDGSATQAGIIVYNSGLLGDTNTTSFASGERVYGYIPLPGDELNVLFLASEGAQAIGDEVGPNANGMFVAAGTGYEVLETITVGASPAAGTLVHVRKL